MSVNKAIVIGHLGADPELKELSNGRKVCQLRIATNYRRKRQDGSYDEVADWHNVDVWGIPAENCATYLSKGSQVYVEGRMTTDQWTDKEGNERRSSKIVAQKVQFLSTGSRRSERLAA